MKRYLIKRLLQAILVLWASATVVFFLVRLTGDPVSLILPPEASVEARQELSRQLGLDRPLWDQYVSFLGGILQGDLGESYWQHRPAIELVLERYPATLKLATAAMVIAIVIAIPVGILSAVYKRTWIDHIAMIGALFGHAMPVFWLGILGILIFSVQLKLLPSFGTGTWQHLIMPSITLALYSTARISRLTRSSMLEVLNADYIRTAYAKGLSRRQVIFKHAIRNALIPIFTLITVEYGMLLGGAVLTETIFAWPGVGWLAVEAISRRDLPLVQAIVISVAWIFVLINLLTDILYSWIDPRIRVEQKGG